jgi:hypothetical protein
MMNSEEYDLFEDTMYVPRMETQNNLYQNILCLDLNKSSLL